MSTWATQNRLGFIFPFIFSSFFLGGYKGGVDLGGLGSVCDQSALYETLKQSIKILCWKKKISFEFFTRIKHVRVMLSLPGADLRGHGLH